MTVFYTAVVFAVLRGSISENSRVSKGNMDKEESQHVDPTLHIRCTVTATIVLSVYAEFKL